jgi:hypothetical protein
MYKVWTNIVQKQVDIFIVWSEECELFDYEEQYQNQCCLVTIDILEMAMKVD